MNLPIQTMKTIPQHWRWMKLKYVASLKSGDSITSDSIDEVGEYPVFGGNGIRGYTSTYTHSGKYVLIGRQGALCGNINYASGDFWASEHAVVVDINNGYEVCWLGELLRAMNLNQYSQSAAQPGISVEVVSNLPIPVPPQHEQSIIASYLDRETTHIDALVGEKEKMLALLEEKCAALISRAITRGLHPDVPLKPSGLGWLGDIPAHWELRRLKFVSEALDQGSSPIAGNLPASPDELGILKLSAVSKGRFKREENKALKESDGNEETLSLRRGDVLITRGNTPELVADVACVPADEPNLLLPDLIYRLRVHTDQVVPEFLTYFLTTQLARVQIRRDARGSSGSMVKVSQGHVLDWQMPLPPLSEQAEIVDQIQEAEKKAQVMNDQLSKSISLLSERRAALITAAVTGQIPMEEMTV